MERDDAQVTLSQVARVRLGTRQALHPIWYPNIAVGAFFVGTAVVMAIEPAGLIALGYWVIAGVLTAGLILRYYVRVERELGVESRAWDASLAIVVATIAAVVAVNLVTDGTLDAIAGMYPAAAGTLALARVLRDPVEAAAGVALALIATAILVLEPSEPWIWGNLGIGVALLAAGLAGRTRTRPRSGALA